MNRCLGHLLSSWIVLVLAGCSTWNANESTSLARLPKTRMSRDSVGIEIATVTLDSERMGMLESIVAVLDEQVISPGTRRHLARNGFRGGILGTQLTEEIELLLLEAAERRLRPTAESYQEGTDQQRFVQCRAGKRVDVGLWGAQRLLETKHDDGDFTTPDAYAQAACQMAVQCKPDDLGGCQVQLTPEIEHGPPRQKYVVDGSSFHVETRRERAVFEDLKMRFPLQPGETLIVTCNQLAEPRLGQNFFQNATSTKQKLLLIRLAQTQIELSFDDE